jgi:hypothetical protein
MFGAVSSEPPEVAFDVAFVDPMSPILMFENSTEAFGELA